MGINILLVLVAFGFIVGILGSIIYWQDSSNVVHFVSHFSATPIALASVYGFSFPMLTLLFVLVLYYVNLIVEKFDLGSKNTIISIFANIVMMTGVCIETMFGKQSSILNYLIGDIFFLDTQDAYIMPFLAILLLIYYVKYHKDIVRNILLGQEDKSRFMQMLCFYIIFYCVKVFGMLPTSFIFAFLPAISFKICNSPNKMVICTGLIMSLCLCMSYFTSIHMDIYFSISLFIYAILAGLIIACIKRCKSYLDTYRYS